MVLFCKPRVCGEKCHVAPCGDFSLGITPAYAGKSSCLWWRKWPCRDHPRVCGEKQLQPGQPTALVGSSPHVRGKAIEVGQFCALGGITPAYAGKASGAMSGSDMDRITPACAGKSWNLEQVVYGPGDHPRVCGEKSELSRYYLSYQGSPPRMRGKANSQPIGS